MTEEPNTLPRASDFAAALGWWCEAGVDLDFTDDATAWLAEPEPESAKPKAPSPPPAGREKPAAAQVEKIPQLGGDPAGWPTDLAAFREWWLAEPSLDTGGTGPRMAPRGDAGAALMVVVGEPEREDRDSLLSGPQGKLLAGFLRAAGIASDTVYLATALPRHMPMPDWPQLQAAGVAKLLDHHVGLVDPQRILVFGRNILPLIGHDMAQGSAVLREFNHQGRSIPVMGARGLAELLRSTQARKTLWQRWLDWTDG